MNRCHVERSRGIPSPDLKANIAGFLNFAEFILSDRRESNGLRSE